MMPGEEEEEEVEALNECNLRRCETRLEIP